MSEASALQRVEFFWGEEFLDLPVSLAVSRRTLRDTQSIFDV